MTRSKFLTCKSGYLSRVYQPRDIAAVLRRLLEVHPIDLRFDTLVGTGLSGALVIPQLAKTMKVRHVIVRKPSEDSHGYHTIEGELGARWLFVDDLQETGRTLRSCIATLEEVSRDYEHPTELVGQFLYGSGEKPGSGTASLCLSTVVNSTPKVRTYQHSRHVIREWDIYNPREAVKFYPLDIPNHAYDLPRRKDSTYV